MFVLLAVADANYCFTCYGSSLDSSVFMPSSFGHMLRDNGLDLPENCSLPGTRDPSLSFVFVGNEAFALDEHLLRPYSSVEKRFLNYHFAWAQRDVECTFGIR